MNWPGVPKIYSRCSYAGIRDRKSTRLNSSHSSISYADFCLKKKMPTDFSKMLNLRILVLYENQLKSSLPEFTKLPSLTYLDIDRNQLTSVPPEISRLTNLTYPDLKNNQLAAVPTEISKLTNLTLLYRDQIQLAIFFFNDTATTEIYTLSLHDALPI